MTKESPLLILVLCEDEAGFTQWSHANRLWLANAACHVVGIHATLPVLFQVSGAVTCNRYADVIDILRTQEGLGSSDVVLTRHNLSIAPQWQETIRKAAKLRDVATATGQLLVHRGTGHEDIMPAQIVQHVTSWQFSPKMHGVVASQLPVEFVYVYRPYATIFAASLANAQDVEGGVQDFFAYLAFKEVAAAAYLPDVKVMRS